MKNPLAVISILLFATSLFCQTSTISYIASDDDIPNPERGFYLSSITYASNYVPLNSNYLASRRDYFTPFNANYQVHTTLVFRYFVLDSFISTSISADFLTKMQADFDAARSAGVKLILRFSYTNTPPAGNCGSWICPPYGDASKSIVLQHIAQLKPLLQSNSDIIATVQMGFIGVWGENYYTDFFGDPSQSPFILTNANWTDRNEVLAALLDAVPEDRSVQVRYPQIKQRQVYGIGAPTTSAPLQLSEAYNNTDKARLGFHNDCFLASDTDFGTYSDYGPPSSQDDTTNLKPYLATDTKFVPMGGETCSANNPDDNCASVGGRADTELQRFHYSYLNSEYNNTDVNNDWTNVCMDDIKKKLGYRFALLTGTYPNIGEAGQSISVTLNVENSGYAAPYNRRGAELVIRHSVTGETFFAPLDVDPRLWLPGNHMINQTICIPPNMPSGNYELLLNLPDPEATLFDNPDYSIQMANDNMWESTTGYNDLNHIIQINLATSNTTCFGGQMFASRSVYDSLYCESILNLSNTIATDIYQADDLIYSDGAINSMEHVIYQAGNSIELETGFEVKSGAIFWTIIGDCYDSN